MYQPPKQEKRRFILEKYIAIHKKGGKMDLFLHSSDHYL